MLEQLQGNIADMTLSFQDGVMNIHFYFDIIALNMPIKQGQVK